MLSEEYIRIKLSKLPEEFEKSYKEGRMAMARSTYIDAAVMAGFLKLSETETEKLQKAFDTNHLVEAFNYDAERNHQKSVQDGRNSKKNDMAREARESVHAILADC